MRFLLARRIMESLIKNLVWSGHWRKVRFQNAELRRNPWKVGRVYVLSSSPHNIARTPESSAGHRWLHSDDKTGLYFQKEIRWDSWSPNRNPRRHNNLEQGGTREKEMSIVFICILTWQSHISGFCWKIKSLLPLNPIMYVVYTSHMVFISCICLLPPLDCELVLIVTHFKCPCNWGCCVNTRSSMNVCQVEI